MWQPSIEPGIPVHADVASEIEVHVICADANLLSWVPHNDSATFESALSWALYSNDQQYINLSTETLPRTVFLCDFKFKYDTEQRYES